MTTTTSSASTAIAVTEPVFTSHERLALAGFLAGYTGLTREAYALDLRQVAVRQARRQPGHPGSLGEQQRPGLGHDPAGIIRHCDLRAASCVLCLKVPSPGSGQDPRQPYPPRSKELFASKGPARPLDGRKAEVSPRCRRSRAHRACGRVH
jgi:hypothetical protein